MSAAMSLSLSLSPHVISQWGNLCFRVIDKLHISMYAKVVMRTWHNASLWRCIKIVQWRWMQLRALFFATIFISSSFHSSSQFIACEPKSSTHMRLISYQVAFLSAPKNLRSSCIFSHPIDLIFLTNMALKMVVGAGK